jgi:hypothetical protein
MIANPSNSSSPGEFIESFHSQCCSSDRYYRPHPLIQSNTEVRKIVALDYQPYIDPNVPGCAVWAVILKAM